MKTVAVIFGGQSGEHEVSLVSARAILSALDPKRFRPLHIAILKDGRWLVGTDAKSYLDGRKSRFGKKPLKLSRGRIDGKKVDIAFPIIHGTYGEDGRLQGLLDMAGIAYVGCGVAASAICMDKDVTKRILRQTGIPVAPGIALCEDDWKDSPKKVRQAIANEAGYPCFVKPARLGSSVGVMKVPTPKRLGHAIEEALRYDDKILVEKAVPDARELECAVIGNGPYDVAGPGEVFPAGEFYDFDDKYVDGKSTSVTDADLPGATRKAIAQAAKDACKALGVEGLARVDFLMPKRGEGWMLNELNTLPGFTSISMYPKLWKAHGMSFRKLVTRLLALAEERHARETSKTYDFSSGSDWFK